MSNTLKTVVEFLEAELNKKLEVSTTSFVSEYSNSERKFGGFTNRKINGEDFMLGLEKVPSKGITLIDFTVDDVEYFARFKVETEAEKEVRVKAENREAYLANDEIYEIQSDKNFTFDSYVFKNKDAYCPLKQGDKVRITTNFTALNFDGGLVQHVESFDKYDRYLIVEADKYFENYEDYLADKRFVMKLLVKPQDRLLFSRNWMKLRLTDVKNRNALRKPKKVVYWLSNTVQQN